MLSATHSVDARWPGYRVMPLDAPSTRHFLLAWDAQYQRRGEAHDFGVALESTPRPSVGVVRGGVVRAAAVCDGFGEPTVLCIAHPPLELAHAQLIARCIGSSTVRVDWERLKHRQPRWYASISFYRTRGDRA